MSRLVPLVEPKKELIPFCVCGRLRTQHAPGYGQCRAFEAKTAENRWRVPDRPGHSTVAPCPCPGCDADVRACLAKGRTDYATGATEARERREAIEARSGRKARRIQQHEEAAY